MGYRRGRELANWRITGNKTAINWKREKRENNSKGLRKKKTIVNSQLKNNIKRWGKRITLVKVKVKRRRESSTTKRRLRALPHSQSLTDLAEPRFSHFLSQLDSVCPGYKRCYVTPFTPDRGDDVIAFHVLVRVTYEKESIFTPAIFLDCPLSAIVVFVQVQVPGQ